MTEPEKRGTPAQGNSTIKIGSVVKIQGNAVNTTWEKGVVVDINVEGALIDYFYPYGIYGGARRVVVSELDVEATE